MSYVEPCCDGLLPCGPDCFMFKLPQSEMNTIGHDYQPYSNPMVLHDDQGWNVPFTQAPDFAPPIFVSVESIRRDTTQFPFSNSFAINLPQPLHGVRSIELIDFCMPTLVETDKPRSNYFFLANGLVHAYNVDAAGNPLVGGEGIFRSQGLVKLYHATEKEESIAFSQNVACNSFGKLFYHSHVPLQVWERQNARKVHFLQTELETLSRLEFSLLNNGALPLPLQKLPLAPPTSVCLAEDEWTCTLMITARAS